ncbi:carboxylesterase/lipase family protein [Kocuria coralli]|uniref:Carboxylic ester hydrolase n=1 Tax=Kocuria coralli TaxID=1461025 RepID=A0A5J5KW28_9MICC|nr:carboxylesterase family protein [Kocuria coralli]KAA9393051.1 carboxylesterase/lipase family protein [Kocuria coralli]
MSSDAIARTSGGLVRGLDRGDSRVFYGIPYAAPPSGDLAFELPRPPAPWAGVRDATAPTATAQQMNVKGSTIPEPSVPGLDILTVNVFTPPGIAPEAGWPVLAYIHGGAYTSGSPVSPWYDGAAFNRDGVIVVTIGYRLGVPGFGEFTDAPSNRAVHDWLAALAWIRGNIAAFGGDPGRLTLAGQSAGAGAVLTLLGVEGIEAFVHRAIAVSPILAMTTPDRARGTTAEAAELLAAEPCAKSFATLPRLGMDQVPSRLRNTFGAAARASTPETDPVTLLRKTSRSLEFAPVLDGDLLTRPIAEGARRSRVPLLIGATAHEMNTDIPPFFGACDHTSLTRLGLPDEEARQYLSLRGGDPEGWRQLLSDLMFRAVVPAVAEGRESTWACDFGYPARGELNPGYAFHCTDLPFVWDCLGAEGVSRALGAAPPQDLADEVHGAWVSFIAGGGPGWPPYAEMRSVRRFGHPESTTVPDGYAAESRLAGLL